MTGLRSLVHIGLTGRGWLLPWMSLLLVSAAMTYAMIGAFNGSWATPYWWPAVAIASPASEGRAAETMAYEQAVRDVRGSCTSLFGSYNYWLFDKDGTGPCGLGVAARGDGGDAQASVLIVGISGHNGRTQGH
jgi:hypothetical protein